MSLIRVFHLLRESELSEGRLASRIALGAQRRADVAFRKVIARTIMPESLRSTLTHAQRQARAVQSHVRRGLATDKYDALVGQRGSKLRRVDINLKKAADKRIQRSTGYLGFGARGFGGWRDLRRHNLATNMPAAEYRRGVVRRYKIRARTARQQGITLQAAGDLNREQQRPRIDKILTRWSRRFQP